MSFDHEIRALMMANQLVSWGLNYDPYQINTTMAKRYEDIPFIQRACFLSTSYRFYEKFGCNREGNLEQFRN